MRVVWNGRGTKIKSKRQERTLVSPLILRWVSFPMFPLCTCTCTFWLTPWHDTMKKKWLRLICWPIWCAYMYRRTWMFCCCCFPFRHHAPELDPVIKYAMVCPGQVNRALYNNLNQQTQCCWASNLLGRTVARMVGSELIRSSVVSSGNWRAKAVGQSAVGRFIALGRKLMCN